MTYRILKLPTCGHLWGKGLTPGQWNALLLLIERTEAGRATTLRQLCEAAGFASVNAGARLVAKLQRMGLATCDSRRGKALAGTLRATCRVEAVGRLEGSR